MEGLSFDYDAGGEYDDDFKQPPLITSPLASSEDVPLSPLLFLVADALPLELPFTSDVDAPVPYAFDDVKEEPLPPLLPPPLEPVVIDDEELLDLMVVDAGEEGAAPAPPFSTELADLTGEEGSGPHLPILIDATSWADSMYETTSVPPHLPPAQPPHYPTLGLSPTPAIRPFPFLLYSKNPLLPPLKDFVPVWRPRPDAALIFEPFPDQFACPMRILRAQLWSFIPLVRGHNWYTIAPILRGLRLVLILGMLSNSAKRTTVACTTPFLTAIHVPHWGWLLGRLAAAVSLIHYCDRHDLHDEGSRMPEQKELDGFQMCLASPTVHRRLYWELARYLIGLPADPSMRDDTASPTILFFKYPINHRPFIGSIITSGLLFHGRNAVELDDELTCRLTPFYDGYTPRAVADADAAKY